MLGDLLSLAISNLLRARPRLIMTAGGVLVATTTVIILVSMTIGLQENAEAGLGSNQALTEIRVYPDRQRGIAEEEIPQLDAAAVSNFQAIAGVQAVIPIAAYPSSGELFAENYVNYAQILGIDSENLPYLGIQSHTGTLALEPGSV
ncbi:MAG: hypothetical protein JXA10_13740, partial [Anaerolineae bacterium]|nr:hypothetical protein [Anaerolineae bacterium]